MSKKRAKSKRNADGYAIDDDIVEALPPALDYDPDARIDRRTRLVVPGKPYFKLAPHQHVLETHAWGRFGTRNDTGLRLLRDPRTGWPVTRDHGDLRPGEVSLVLE
jgi:hypothetical protein